MRTLVFALVSIAVLVAHEGHGKKNAPESAQKLKSPLTPAQSKPELGKPAYERVCAGCHGVDGLSKTPAAANMTPKPTNLTDHLMDSMKDGEIYWVVTNGIGKSMPAFKDMLTETERWQVVNYTRSLRKSKPGNEHEHH
jgi:mono/diheme cytochrome c family protein